MMLIDSMKVSLMIENEMETIKITTAAITIANASSISSSQARAISMKTKTKTKININDNEIDNDIITNTNISTSTSINTSTLIGRKLNKNFNYKNNYKLGRRLNRSSLDSIRLDGIVKKAELSSSSLLSSLTPTKTATISNTNKSNSNNDTLFNQNQNNQINHNKYINLKLPIIDTSAMYSMLKMNSNNSNRINRMAFMQKQLFHLDGWKNYFEHWLLNIFIRTMSISFNAILLTLIGFWLSTNMPFAHCDSKYNF